MDEVIVDTNNHQNLTYAKGKLVTLRKVGLNEKWLQDKVSEDPSILGLGNLELIERERPTHPGRLDLLLQSPDSQTRYEAELMLGSTDESHIIRTIEYWDIERRRYPGYEHVAVLIAEDVTSRFLNVLSLFSGSIAFVALQMQAVAVNNQLILSFAKVVDSRMSLRTDDEYSGTEIVTDRNYWIEKSSQSSLKVADEILKLINQCSDETYVLNYNKYHIGIQEQGATSGTITIHFNPRKKYTLAKFRGLNLDEWSDQLDNAGIQAEQKRGFLQINLTAELVHETEDLIEKMVSQTMA